MSDGRRLVSVARETNSSESYRVIRGRLHSGYASIRAAMEMRYRVDILKVALLYNGELWVLMSSFRIVESITYQPAVTAMFGKAACFNDRRRRSSKRAQWQCRIATVDFSISRVIKN